MLAEEIKAFMSSQRTWFDLDEEDEQSLLYATRDHGSVGDESPGKVDIIEGRRLRDALKMRFAGNVQISLQIVDEWVHLEILFV